MGGLGLDRLRPEQKNSHSGGGFAWVRSSRRRGAVRGGTDCHTDASHRFERGADFNACGTANALVAELILAVGRRRRRSSWGDVVIPASLRRHCRPARCAFGRYEVWQHLQHDAGRPHPGRSAITGELVRPVTSRRLAAHYNPRPTTWQPATFNVSSCLPGGSIWQSTRSMRIEEEIARVHGYNRFANTLPTAHLSSPPACCG